MLDGSCLVTLKSIKSSTEMQRRRLKKKIARGKGTVSFVKNAVQYKCFCGIARVTGGVALEKKKAKNANDDKNKAHGTNYNSAPKKKNFQHSKSMPASADFVRLETKAASKTKKKKKVINDINFLSSFN